MGRGLSLSTSYFLVPARSKSVLSSEWESGCGGCITVCRNSLGGGTIRLKGLVGRLEHPIDDFGYRQDYRGGQSAMMTPQKRCHPLTSVMVAMLGGRPHKLPGKTGVALPNQRPQLSLAGDALTGNGRGNRRELVSKVSASTVSQVGDAAAVERPFRLSDALSACSSNILATSDQASYNLAGMRGVP